MAKTLHDNVLDAALQYLEDNADLLTVCNAQPTNYTEASATYKLADVTIDSADFTGPADGSPSGRKTTVNEQADVPIDTTGTAVYIALCDVGSTALLAVTSCSSQSLTSGNTVTIPAFDITLLDPV